MANPSDRDKPVAFPAWEPQYREALAETNPLRLGEKLHAAQTAISSRIGEIKDSPANAAERRALDEAASALQSLQIKTFGPSDWQI